ncbi:MAG: hypothetical protein KA138_03260, partial [Saprospiraceae bacterium]|nr:hypothetical protein [Saprospiraceae bacterium]
MNWFYTKTVGIPSCLSVLLLLLWLLPGTKVHAYSSGSANINLSLVAAPPNWVINPDDFEFNMSLIVRVNFSGTPSNNASNIVGVFVGNELRGVATPISILGDQYFYITAYSNQYFGEILTFRVYYA